MMPCSPAPGAAAPSLPTSVGDSNNQAAAAAADAYELEHVHHVYSAIAPHFSHTRHKAWPAVARFLLAQRPGSVGVDIGCGNGKYLAVNPAVYILACDRSAELVSIARERKRMPGASASSSTTTTTTTTRAGDNDIVVADGLALPFPPHRADFAICIAVIHHLSTRTRRRHAIRRVLECIRPGRRGGGNDHGGGGGGGGGGGKAMIYVWALEQASSRRGWESGGEQDLLVPWVVTGAQKRSVAGRADARVKRDSLPQKTTVKGGVKKNAASQGPAGSNDSFEAEEGNEEEKNEEREDEKKDEKDEKPPATSEALDKQQETFLRYYHLYAEGELEDDVCAAGGVVVESGYERDNWWAICSHWGDEQT